MESLDTAFVAGASGDTGRAVCRLLAPRVERLRALTSSPEKRDQLRRAGADEVVVDDLLDPSELVEALDGVDAVLSAVGSSVTDVWKPGPLVDGVGTRNLLSAAVEAGVEAFVMESAIGVGDDPASPLAAAFDVAIGPVQRAKAESEAAIREAPVRHTILRPGVLTGGPRTGEVTVAEPGAKLWGTVSRADVAWTMAAAPLTEGAADRTLELVSSPRFPGRGIEVDWRLPSREGDAVPVDVLE